MNLDEIYTELIAEHNQNKKNKRSLDNPTIVEHGHNPSCGDEISINLKLNEDKIEDLSYEGQGCAISQASSSIMIDILKGKTANEAKELIEIYLKMIKREENDDEVLKEKLEEAYIFKNISNMPSRVKCAVLAWHTLDEAIRKVGN